MKNWSLWLPVIACAVLVAGCGGGGSPAGNVAPAALQATERSTQSLNPNPVATHLVDPRLTDPNITTDYFYRTFTYAPPAAKDNGLLLVFLPGQGAHPGAYITLSTYAATLGYHVVALGYPNANTPQNVCVTPPIAVQDACNFDFLLQLWDGHAGASGVTPANAIGNRLAKLLPYLGANYPNENWAEFADPSGNAPWARIVLAGHSLGSWEAAAIGKVEPAKRVVLFAGPEDLLPNGAAPTWLAQPGQTPAAAYYAFAHLGDPMYPASALDASALGMDAFGGWTSVDGNHGPWQSHELSTNLATSGVFPDDPHHTVVAFNNATVLNPLGYPIYPYTEAWRTLFAP